MEARLLTLLKKDILTAFFLRKGGASIFADPGGSEPGGSGAFGAIYHPLRGAGSPQAAADPGASF